MRISRGVPAGFGSLALVLFSFVAAAAPKLPNINTNNIITITSPPYNAVGDGVTDNTLAISNAIFTAASGGLVNGLIGGTVRIPGPGVFLTGPLTLRNNVNIQVDEGAILRMQPLNVWITYPAQNQTYGNLFYASGLTNLELSGFGAIDGQGLAWWTNNTSVFNNRPYAIYFNSGCKQVLIQNVTLSNTPAHMIVFKGRGGNITVSNLTELTPSSFGPTGSHNTDGIDLVGTNILIQECHISVGDDNLALGTSSANTPTSDLLVTNCAFGDGHGLSIGSNTAGGVSNLTVINCTFDGTEYGIRMKSDDNTGGGSGVGGVAQNLRYFNIVMTNIVRCPIVIYSYYSSYGTPTNITPLIASTQPVDATPVPVWRNITISNLTASLGPSGGPAGILWGQIEVPATNVVFSRVNITASRSFGIYNARGVQFVDSQITVPAGIRTLAVFNAGLTVTNSDAGAGTVTVDGLTSTNTLALYSAPASMTAADAFGTSPITLRDAVLTISNSLTLPGSATVNFTLGTNVARIAATGNLTLNSTLNLSAGNGFGPGIYTIFTCGGGLSGVPVLGTTPPTGGHAWLYNLDTATPGQVNFIVANPPPPVIDGIALDRGTNVVVSGGGGTTNFSYFVLASTNVALPLDQWSRIATNQFLPNGNFIFTNGISAGAPQRFFILQYP